MYLLTNGLLEGVKELEGMTQFQKFGYIFVSFCFVVWLIFLFTGQSNSASNIAGAISFISLLVSIFNPFDRSTKNAPRRDGFNSEYFADDAYWTGNSQYRSNRDGFGTVALGITVVFFIATLVLAIYPLFQSWTERPNASDPTSLYLEFRDEALDKAVHQAMNIDEGLPIPLSQARNISVLNLSTYTNSITNLTGISGFTNLEELDIHNNNISNISDLKNLRSLRVLHIEKNSIKDLSPLKELTSLRELDLEDNKIKSIYPLRNLTDLTMLDVSRNNIGSIEAVKNMTELKQLYISYNRIKDISPIANLSKVYLLSMRDNNIENMDVLRYLPNLKILSICYNPLKSKDVILNLTGLDHLRIDAERFTGDEIEQLRNIANELIVEKEE